MSFVATIRPLSGQIVSLKIWGADMQRATRAVKVMFGFKVDIILITPTIDGQ